MVPEMEKPRVTEIKVRMDCNGCVQKIKKALQGIAGIHDIYVDFPEQKLTVTGWAEPEKLVKAIRKTRKSAVICVHTEESDPPEGEEASPGEGAPPPVTPPEPTNQRGEPPRTEAAPPAEAQDEPPPPQPENSLPETRQPHHQQTRPNDVEGVHVVYHHPPNHGYGGPWNAYHVGTGFRDDRHPPPPPVYVQSYNTFRPSPHVTEYANPRPPPPRYSYDTIPNHYSNPGFRDEPPQQPQPPPPQPQPSPPPRYTYDTRPDHYSSPGFRDEPPQPQPQPQPPPQQQQQPLQPPQPVYATHSYNTYKPSPYVTGYAYPQSPPRYSTYTRPDSSSGPGLRAESEQSQPSQPPQPVYATHNHNIFRPSPYVTEYAYPESPLPRYSSYSIPDNYSRDYYDGSHGNGNMTSMFSEENPNACRIV